MQKHNLYILSLTLLMFVFVSCEKVVQDVDVPHVEEQLVLFGFISPEEPATTIQLTLSDPIFNGKRNTSGIRYVTDATVILKDAAGNSVTLVFADSIQQYIVGADAFPIMPGQTYIITAAANNKTVTATCTVPVEKVVLSAARYQKTGQPSSSNPDYRYTYEWKDIPGKANYYRVTTASVWNNGRNTSYHEICQGLPVDDRNRDGQTMSGICEDYNNGFARQGNLPFGVAFFMLNTDVDYYEYHRRRIPYEEGNPFSEPYEQYSNVAGGLGVFCSYRKSETVISVTE